MSPKQFLHCAIVALIVTMLLPSLSSCTAGGAFSAEKTTEAAATGLAVMLAAVNRWAEAGIISHEDAAQLVVGLQKGQVVWDSVLQLVGIIGGKVSTLTAQVAQTKSEAEGAIPLTPTTVGTGLGALGGAIYGTVKYVNAQRDSARLQRGEPVGKTAPAS